MVAPATGSGSGSAAPAAGLAFDDGLVGASIELAKPGYKIPFTVFAVFDRAADGAWSLVHIHFAA